MSDEVLSEGNHLMLEEGKELSKTGEFEKAIDVLSALLERA